ncbi:MAG: hypothetical protein IIC76_07330, partial [Bacteroidetes bacterium]|nr:hypothetical protein [Bacteroidota bacterium]
MFNFLYKILSDADFWKILIAILTPVIVAIIGIWRFKKQREYELVQKRYLDEGFDKLINDYENAMASYHHNWQLSFIVLKQVRDLPKDLISKKAITEYFGLGRMVLPTIALHRVNNLFNNKKLWEMHQLLYAFIQDSYFTFEYDFKIAVENYINDSPSVKVTRKDIYDKYLECFQEMNNKSKKHDVFIGYIKEISSIFEKNSYSKKALKN